MKLKNEFIFRENIFEKAAFFQKNRSFLTFSLKFLKKIKTDRLVISLRKRIGKNYLFTNCALKK